MDSTSSRTTDTERDDEGPALAGRVYEGVSGEPHFMCPDCGGTHFGTNDTSNMRPLQRVSCHDQYRKGCRWRGYIDHESPTRRYVRETVPAAERVSP